MSTVVIKKAIVIGSDGTIRPFMFELQHGASSEEKVDVGLRVGEHSAFVNRQIIRFSIYTLSDLGVLRNLIVSLSLANEHYAPPTE